MTENNWTKNNQNNRDVTEPKIRCLEERTIFLPTYIIGPLHVRGQYAFGDYKIPIATAEVPLIPSTSRGIKIANLCGGVETIIVKDEMTRAPLFSTTSSAKAEELCQYLRSNFLTLYEVVAKTTLHGKLTSIEALQHGSDAYVRIGMFCADAAGHNMTTKAAQYIWEHIRSLPQFQNEVDLFIVSSNYCTDKKPARINVKKGRGKTVFASLHITQDILEKNLHTTAQRLEQVNHKKNHVGSRLAGCVGGMNAHHANIVAAMYLALGQDVANVVEGSLGSTSVTSHEDGSAMFKVHLPALIVGTIGGGTKLPHAKQNLEMLGLYGPGDPAGSHAKALAEVIAATVLTGELSLMAALSNNGEHWRAHQHFERS